MKTYEITYADGSTERITALLHSTETSYDFCDRGVLLSVNRSAVRSVRMVGEPSLDGITAEDFAEAGE